MPNSDELFPGTIINGGIVVTYWDETAAKGNPSERSHITPSSTQSFKRLSSPTSSRWHRRSRVRARIGTHLKMHDDVPAMPRLQIMSRGEAVQDRTPRPLEQLSFPISLCRATRRWAIAARVLGLDGKKRTSRWTRSEYVTGPENFPRPNSRLSRPCIPRGSPQDVRRVDLHVDPWRAPARGTAGCGHPDLHHHRRKLTHRTRGTAALPEVREVENSRARCSAS